MSAASITFRCYQCSKLLGVSRSRAGAVVTCPKCSAELLVPQPTDTTPPPMPAVPTEPASSEPDPAALFRSLLEPRPESTDPAPAPARDQPFPMPGNAPSQVTETGPPAGFFPVIATEPESLRADSSQGRSKASGRPKAAPDTTSRPPLSEPPASPAVESASPLASLFGTAPPEPAQAGPTSPFPLTLDPEPVSLRPEAKPRSKPAARPAPSEKPAPVPPPELAGSAFPPPSVTEETALPTMEFSTEGLRRSPSARAEASAKQTPQRAVEPATVPWPSFEESASSRVVAPASPSIATAPEPLRTQPTPAIVDRTPGVRRDDVTMPRTAVVLWSFFVLMSLVTAFAAGLLAGHFLWK